MGARAISAAPVRAASTHAAAASPGRSSTGAAAMGQDATGEQGAPASETGGAAAFANALHAASGADDSASPAGATAAAGSAASPGTLASDTRPSRSAVGLNSPPAQPTTRTLGRTSAQSTEVSASTTPDQIRANTQTGIPGAALAPANPCGRPGDAAEASARSLPAASDAASAATEADWTEAVGATAAPKSPDAASAGPDARARVPGHTDRPDTASPSAMPDSSKLALWAWWASAPGNIDGSPSGADPQGGSNAIGADGSQSSAAVLSAQTRFNATAGIDPGNDQGSARGSVKSVAAPDSRLIQAATAAPPGPLVSASGTRVDEVPTAATISLPVPNARAQVGAAGAGGAASAALAVLPPLLQGLAASLPTSAGMPQIAVPVADPRWAQALAAQVQWMANSQMQSATLRLSPAHLGPLEVRIELQHSQINVSFSAAHPDTRNALAEAVPQLRQLLAAGGLSLGQASVQQQAHPDARSAGGGWSSANDPVRESAEPVAVSGPIALGLIDEYV